MFLRFNDGDEPVILYRGVEYPIASGATCDEDGFWLESQDLSDAITSEMVEAEKPAIQLTEDQEAECLRSAQLDHRQQEEAAAKGKAWNDDLPLWEHHVFGGGGRASTRSSSDGVGLRGGGRLSSTEWWEHPTRGKTYTKPAPQEVPQVVALADLLAAKRETKIHNLASGVATAKVWVSHNREFVPEDVLAAL